MNIADRIQSLRKSKGVSQEELADQIGVSRQAVSKWESEQSLPDLEKIILLSNYFEVTTDYLLKGIESDVAESHDCEMTGTKEKVDARIYSAVGTGFNFIGLVTSIVIWKERQTTYAVAVGLIAMALGCLVYAVGQYTGDKRKESFQSFWLINIWLLSLIPISCIFNFVEGTLGGFWWTLTPIPQRGNSIAAFGFCFYLMVCIITDIRMLSLMRKKKAL